MAELVHDPVNRVRYAFQRDGDNLIVDCLVDPGGSLPAHRHPRQVERYRGETSPSFAPATRAANLIALLARDSSPRRTS